jgi:hypothetical protein
MIRNLCKPREGSRPQKDCCYAKCEEFARALASKKNMISQMAIDTMPREEGAFTDAYVQERDTDGFTIVQMILLFKS